MYDARVKIFEDILLNSPIDIKKLRKECQLGCPDSNGLRSKIWKVLLNYLPLDHSQWNKFLTRSRREYSNLATEFVVSSTNNESNCDDPLSCNPDSDWRKYFDDNEVLLQINKDCRRLYPEFDFFRRSTSYPFHKVYSPSLTITALRNRLDMDVFHSRTMATDITGAKKLLCEKQKHPLCSSYEESDSEFHSQEAHWEVAQRIIFIYCKVNQRSSYVQGMNEVLGPIYYLFANDPDPEWQMYAEADAFYCFNNLMAEIQSNFIRSFDEDIGIGSKMEQMFSLLAEFDPKLAQHLTYLHLEPTHFAFRWITVLLAREFLLPDVLRLWDSILSDEQRFDLVLYICCAMLILLRNDLIRCDFPRAVHLVQNYPNSDVASILTCAADLYARHHP
uniref:TBC1 domain family member 13 n=2 Tax=Schistocephalus solidus TaxID=70667 RepID=A0A0V0J1E1_SCHSO